MNYASRRKKLYSLLGEDYSICLKGGSSDFVYLTGIDRDDVAFSATPEGETLYIPETDPMKERWFGRMIHPDEVLPKYGIENVVYPIPELEYKPCPEIATLRAVKSEEEIAEIEKAIRLTGDGIMQVYKTARAGLYEYNLRAEFEKVLADAGCHVPAFDTIVGAGENSLCLHYCECDRVLQDGDLVLLDLGAVSNFLCADISRVFPVGGKFSERQRALTQLACDTVDYVCKNIRPGEDNARLNALQDAFLAEHLPKIGLNGEVKDYRWHNISHHLGYEVHDTPPREAPLMPGSVFTLEVGIYVQDWGFGVRVEDDALMTESGCRNLSRNIPRTPDEIEAIL